MGAVVALPEDLLILSAFSSAFRLKASFHILPLSHLASILFLLFDTPTPRVIQAPSDVEGEKSKIGR
jgi:hypothetical protein